MLKQMYRTKEEIANDSPCIGTCTLDEDNICIGCNRHIDEITLYGEVKIPLK
tara:strand:- start:240 stop:395 length:156 start_codon:yes stop_codon:yes gene_type:complete